MDRYLHQSFSTRPEFGQIPWNTSARWSNLHLYVTPRRQWFTLHWHQWFRTIYLWSGKRINQRPLPYRKQPVSIKQHLCYSTHKRREYLDEYRKWYQYFLAYQPPVPQLDSRTRVDVHLFQCRLRRTTCQWEHRIRKYRRCTGIPPKHRDAQNRRFTYDIQRFPYFLPNCISQWSKLSSD